LAFNALAAPAEARMMSLHSAAATALSQRWACSDHCPAEPHHPVALGSHNPHRPDPPSLVVPSCRLLPRRGRRRRRLPARTTLPQQPPASCLGHARVLSTGLAGLITRSGAFLALKAAGTLEAAQFRRSVRRRIVAGGIARFRHWRRPVGGGEARSSAPRSDRGPGREPPQAACGLPKGLRPSAHLFEPHLCWPRRKAAVFVLTRRPGAGCRFARRNW